MSRARGEMARGIQQQLLRERRFSCIRMADDGQVAPAQNLALQCWRGRQTVRHRQQRARDEAAQHNSVEIAFVAVHTHAI